VITDPEGKCLYLTSEPKAKTLSAPKAYKGLG
jgi:hypothetical protein